MRSKTLKESLPEILSNTLHKSFLCKNVEMVDFDMLYILARSVTRTPLSYEGWNFNSGNYLFTTDTK